MNTAAVAGTPFVIDDGRENGEIRTRVPASAPFYFTAHPERWRVLGGKVRPLLAKGLKLYPGRHNLTEGRGGRTRGIARARAAKEDAGRIVIPLDSVPDSHADADGTKCYLYSPAGRPDVVLDIYTQVFPGTKRTHHDAERWHEFLDHQVETGVVPTCPTYVLEGMYDDETKKAAKAADRAHTVPSAALVAKRHADCAAVIKVELDARAKAAKPVRRRKVKVEEDA